MKISYSKLLVHGVIATTLLMAMSCQKKGSARGVQPETITTDPTVDKVDQNAKKELSTKKADDPSLAKVENKDLDKTLKEEPLKEKPSAKVAKTTVTTSTPPTSKDKVTPVKAPPAVVKKEIPSCPEKIVKAQQDILTLSKKIVSDNQISTTKKEVTKANYEAYVKLCLAWPKLLISEKVEVCLAEGEVKGKTEQISYHAATYEESCDKQATALKDITGQPNEITIKNAQLEAQKLAALKTSQIAVSDEAKEMFNKENIAWNMFIVDGELQTDSAQLTDALKAKKVACTISKAALDKYTHDQKVIVSITDVSELISTEETDKVKDGVEFAISMKASAKDMKDVIESSSMYCSGLNAKKLNVKALKAALGQKLLLTEAHIMNRPAQKEKEITQK